MYYKIVILSFLIALTSGCYNMINKLYDYNSPELKTNNAIVSSKLIGTFKSSGKLATKGSPYELIINTECVNNGCRAISISNIKLTKLVNDEVIYNNKHIFKPELTKFSDGKLNAQISVKNIDIEYNDLALEFDLTIDSNLPTSNSVIRLTFNKTYKEYKSNVFWERIMGV